MKPSVQSQNSVLLAALVFLLILPYQLKGQSFPISDGPAWDYSFDKFANEVYYVGSSGVFIRNMEDWSVKESPFPSLPAFANNSHKCAYGDGDSIFVYDFDTREKFKVADNIEYYEYEFSPDDDYLLLYLKYFSFSDSTLHPMNFTPDPFFLYDWGTDTTLYCSYNDNYILSYNFITDDLDTVLSFDYNQPVSAFSYNRTQNLLYYGIDEYINPKIHSYDPLTQMDSIVFNPEYDSTDNCWATFNWFREMEWSPDSSKMVFFSYILEWYGTIYTYNPGDNRVYKFTECGGETNEYQVGWLNNDTIIYTDDGMIYGFGLTHPLSTEEDKPVIIPSSFEISSYPNPFNGVIHFNLTGEIKEPDLRIYNINGEEVARLTDLEGFGSKYTAVWNGRNSSGAEAASGVYLVIVRDKQNPLSIKGSSKIIYLK